MASNILSAPTINNRRPKSTEYPADSIRFDRLIAAFSAIFLLGLYFDGWAHNNIPNRIETFFTPYHALLYGGYIMVAVVLTFTHLRNLFRGYAWSKSLPQGYFLALLGIGLFSIGGIGDFLWHETFGFEEDTEALLSPTHLLLAMGAVLYCSGPLRAAWRRVTPSNTQSTWRDLTPALVAMLILLSIFTFFTQYATLARSMIFVTAPFTADNFFYYDATALFRVIMPSILVTGAILYLIRRWHLPFGAMVFLIGVNYTLMFAMLMNNALDTPATLPAILLASVVIEWLYMRLQPSIERLGALRWFAFLTPFIMISLFVLSLLLTRGMWWQIHMWAGVPVLAGIFGLLLSHLAFPSMIPITVEPIDEPSSDSQTAYRASGEALSTESATI